jgi:hypothetical protein
MTTVLLKHDYHWSYMYAIKPALIGGQYNIIIIDNRIEVCMDAPL